MTENISGAGCAATRGVVLGIFRLQAMNIVEMFASSHWKDDSMQRWFEFDGRGELDRALAGGRGAILVTGHIGSWELGALYLRSLGYDLHVVAGTQMNKLLTGAIKDVKEKRGISVINPEHSPLRLLKALASNGVLALLVDGNIYAGGEEIAIFGKKARIPGGPVRLAKASGAPIIGGYCRRAGSRKLAIHLEYIASADEIEALPESESLARVYGVFERFIGRNADQWCLFRRFWGERGQKGPGPMRKRLRGYAS